MSGRSRRADLVHAAHVVHGSALLARPAVVAGVDGGAPGRTVAVVRVLGARHVLQGLAGLAAPRFASPARGAAVDGVHAASMAGLALIDRAHRRGATVSALVAVAFAAGGWWAARRGPTRARALVVPDDLRAGCTATRGGGLHRRAGHDGTT